MKTKLFFLIIAAFVAVSVSAQDGKLLRAADKSFDAGEQDYSKKRWSEAAESLEIVVENIPIYVESRKYMILRFDAHVMLIDIYFNQLNNLPAGCRCLNSFFDDLNYLKNVPNLKSKDIFKYLELEKDYAKYKSTCDNFEDIDSDKKEFEKKFNEEFED